MLREILTILVLTASLQAFAQGYGPHVDSLLFVADHAEEDAADSAYMEVGRALAYIQPAFAFQFLNKSLDIARRTGDFRVMCMAHSFKGIAYSRIGNYGKSMDEFKLQMEVAKSHGFTDEVAWASNNIGLDMLELKNYDMASFYLSEALRIAEPLHDDYINQFIYTNIGLLNTERENYAEALRYLNLSLDIRKKSPEDSINLSAAFRDIGNVYFRQHNFEKTKYCYGVSMSLVDSMSTTMHASMNVVLAEVFLVDEMLDSALISGHSAVSIARKAGEKNTLRDAFAALGRISYKLANYKDAERFFSLSIAYDDSVKSSGVTHKIFDLCLQRQIHQQQMDIETAENHTKTNLHFVFIIAALLIVSVVLAFWISRKRNVIADMNSRLKVRSSKTEESIEYAGKIQKAVIPNFDDLVCPRLDKFLLYCPKNVVSGTFFWFHVAQSTVMLAAIDTGEDGVPGGCFSMLGSYILQDIAESDSDPSIILDILRTKLRAAIGSIAKQYSSQGADISLAILDTESGVLRYSGLKMPLVLVSNGTLSLVQGQNSEKNSLHSIDFVTAETRLAPGDRFYILTNGYSAQEGGLSREPYSRERLYAFILKISSMPMDQQKQLLKDELDAWVGFGQSRRDIVVMGFGLKMNC